MDDTQYARVMSHALRFISIRPRSCKEMHAYLIKKIPSPDDGIYDRVMNRLTELGYVDDVKFAQWLVDQRQTHAPKGNQFIERELTVKGIPKETILQVLRTGDRGKQTDLARTAVLKKMQIWSALPPIQQRKKIYGYLGRRGFDSDTIYTVIDEVVQKSYNNGDE